MEDWASSCTSTLSVATAYLTQPGLNALVGAIGEDAIRDSRWLTCLSYENAIRGSTSPEACSRLLRLGAEVRALESLHAKLYLLEADDSLMVGSATSRAIITGVKGSTFTRQ